MNASGLTTPPHNLDAEEALLGSVLIDGDILGEIVLPAEAFYLIKHQWIWAAFQKLAADHQPIDLLTVREELDRHDQLTESGGPAYLTRLCTLVPSSFHAAAYAKLVTEAYTRRQLIQAAGQVAKYAYDMGADIETVKSQAVRVVGESADHGYQDTLQPIAQDAADLMDKVAEGRVQGELLKTRLVPLDNNIGGLDIDTLTLLAGRPGMSKTAALLQIADLVSEAEPESLVAVFSKEMSRAQCLLRMACRRAHVSVQSIRNGEAHPDDRDIVAQWLAYFTNRTNLYIDERKEQTTAEVLAECRKLERRKGKICLILGDHLRLFTDKHNNDVLRLGLISRGFKVIAGELHTRVLLAAQLNRGPENRAEDDRDPTMADIRGSGQIEEDADNIFGLNRPAYYDKSSLDKTVRIIPLKLRDGDAGAITLMDFEARYMGFERKPA